MLVRRAHERHSPITRRSIDRDPCFHQLFAGRIDVVDLVGEMTEVPGLPAILSLPIVGEFDKRRLAAAALAVLHPIGVLRGGEKDQCVTPLLVDAPPNFSQPKLVAIEVQSIVKIADAQHCMEISHLSFLVEIQRKPYPKRQDSGLVAGVADSPWIGAGGRCRIPACRYAGPSRHTATYGH